MGKLTGRVMPAREGKRGPRRHAVLLYFLNRRFGEGGRKRIYFLEKKKGAEAISSSDRCQDGLVDVGFVIQENKKAFFSFSFPQ